MKNIKAITGKSMTKKAQIQNAMAMFRTELTYTDEIRAYQVGPLREEGQRILYVHQFTVKDLMMACDAAGCIATLHHEVSRDTVNMFPGNSAVGEWFKISVH